jgi:hypothetical protein
MFHRNILFINHIYYQKKLKLILYFGLFRQHPCLPWASLITFSKM